MRIMYIVHVHQSMSHKEMYKTCRICMSVNEVLVRKSMLDCALLTSHVFVETNTLLLSGFLLSWLGVPFLSHSRFVVVVFYRYERIYWL